MSYGWRQIGGGRVTLTGATIGSRTTATFMAPMQLAETATLVFELTVTDARDATGTATVVVEVVPGENDAPTADAGDDQVVDEGDVVTLDGAGSDPEDEMLVYGWRQISGSQVSLYDAGARSTTFVAPVQLVSSETLTFVLVATDTRGLSSPAERQLSDQTTNTVVITVRPGANDAPTADAGFAQVVSEGAVVILDGDASNDPEKEALVYVWSQTRGVRVTLTNAMSVTASFTAPMQLVSDEELEFALRVTDTRGAVSTTATVVVTVRAGANDAPVADAGDDQVVDEGGLVTLDGDGSSDPEREDLTYGWRQIGGGRVTLTGATIGATTTTTTTVTFTAPDAVGGDGDAGVRVDGGGRARGDGHGHGSGRSARGSERRAGGGRGR